MRKKIPVAEPVIGREEERLVVETLRSGWISSLGEHIQNFEAEFARFCGVKYGVATSNGTCALHLALAASGIGPRQEVIIPSLTFVATANAVLYVGAKPVFVDSELETWNINPAKIEEKITSRTRAIIPVHLYGHPANIKPILRIAKKYKLLVIEDAAEAHGAEIRSRKVGSFGMCGCFSFYGNKIITTGEGGMVVTNNRNFAQQLRTLRDHGVSKKRRYFYPQLGFNFRMTNVQAAIGVAQLKKIDRIIRRKKQIAKLYTKYLKDLGGKIILPPKASWATNVYWMYSILIPKQGRLTRDRVAAELAKKGIDSRPFFYPLHKTRRFGCYDSLPVASFLARSGLNLPSSPSLKDSQIKFICWALIDIIA